MVVLVGSYVEISLINSRKVQWFQCTLCLIVTSFNIARICKGLVPNKYVNTAFSNVRVFKRVTEHSRGLLAESM